MLLTFQPVNSHVYEMAREGYQKGVLELGLIKFQDEDSDSSNFHCSKKHLLNCIAILNNLYYMRQIECIDELPTPELIPSLGRTKLKLEFDKLKDLYFPRLIN